MHSALEGSIPSGMKVELPAIDNLDAYEKPLVASFTVHGSLGTMTAKRIIIPGQFFEANSKPPFPQPTTGLRSTLNTPENTSTRCV